MAKYPDAQKKAHDQAELDAVIGRQRLPEFNDRSSLPYVNAVIKEALRWQLVAPLGKSWKILVSAKFECAQSFKRSAIPHVATDDDVYGGYFISQGSIVLGNAWYVTQSVSDSMTPKLDHYLRQGSSTRRESLHRSRRIPP